MFRSKNMAVDAVVVDAPGEELLRHAGFVSLQRHAAPNNYALVNYLTGEIVPLRSGGDRDDSCIRVFFRGLSGVRVNMILVPQFQLPQKEPAI